MNPKKEIEEVLNGAVSAIFPSTAELKLQTPDDSKNGDYYTSAAMRLTRDLKKKPLDIAYEIKGELEKKPNHDFTTEAVPPGFVNFFLTDEFLNKVPSEINNSKDYGETDSLSGQKVIIEYTGDNPFKEFHIGHLYNNVLGESLARLFEAQNADVIRVSYKGDVGLHIAKAIYGMRRLESSMPQDDSTLANRAQYLGQAYALGATKYDEAPEIKKEIDQLNKTIYEAVDDEINELYTKGRTWSLEYLDSLYARVGTKFDHFYFESEMTPPGLAFVQKYLKEGIFEESEGAIIFPAEKYGFNSNAVFVNSMGIPTYGGKDMALALAKYKDFPYDKSFILTAAEQSSHFQIVIKALSLTNPDLAEKTKHISHGLVKLPGGKISSRAGGVPTGEWLMDEAKSRVMTAYPEIEDDVAEKVGLAAIKFAFLKAGVGSDITFNIDDSIAMTGFSGPYLQYAYVRTKSILEENKKFQTEEQEGEHELELEEKDLIRHLIHYPEVVQNACEKLSPNLVAEYLFQTAQKFNSFYEKCNIKKAKSYDREPWLDLTSATGQVIKNGLNLLGIETVDKM